MSPRSRCTARFAPAADEDLDRLLDYLIDRAKYLEDLVHAQEVITMLRKAIEDQLGFTPWSFRKAVEGGSSTRRELIVPAGRTGYLALYEIENNSSVVILAVRHLLESDYH